MVVRPLLSILTPPTPLILTLVAAVFQTTISAPSYTRRSFHVLIFSTMFARLLGKLSTKIKYNSATTD